MQSRYFQKGQNSIQKITTKFGLVRLILMCLFSFSGDQMYIFLFYGTSSIWMNTFLWIFVSTQSICSHLVGIDGEGGVILEIPKNIVPENFGAIVMKVAQFCTKMGFLLPFTKSGEQIQQIRIFVEW